MKLNFTLPNKAAQLKCKKGCDLINYGNTSISVCALGLVVCHVNCNWKACRFTSASHYVIRHVCDKRRNRGGYYRNYCYYNRNIDYYNIIQIK